MEDKKMDDKVQNNVRTDLSALKKVAAIFNADCDKFASRPVWADEYWIDPDEEYTEPHYSLFQGETGFLPLGDFQLIKAKKKSGKTYVCSILAISLLGSETFGFTTATKDVRIVYFDTEQSKDDAKRVQRRVFRLAQIDPHKTPEKFNIFGLRDCPTPNRMPNILQKIEQIKPTHIFIDGIVDLGYNYMDNEKSVELMTLLLSTASKYNCSIIGVLHTNKGIDDHNGRGFLGTEAGNKCSEEMEVAKRNGMEKVFDVTMTDCRHRPINPWSFALDGKGMPIPCQQEVKEDKSVTKLKELAEIIHKSFGKDTELTSKELLDRIQTNAVCKERKAYGILKEAVTAQIVCAVDGKNKTYKLPN